MKYIIAAVALCALFMGCLILPIPIAVHLKSGVVFGARTRVDRFVILSKQSDARLQPLLVEGVRSTDGHFQLHAQLQAPSDIEQAHVYFRCFGVKNQPLCAGKGLLRKTAAGVLVAHTDTQTAFDEVAWFEIYWAAGKSRGQS